MYDTTHHTIISVDVERFGGRPGAAQRRVREALYAAMEESFDHCGLAWKDCHSEDRGDGLLVLVPPGADNPRLAECLPNELAARLREHNATADRKAKIRLRMVMHSGEIEHDRPGYNGPALVPARRLLDSKVLHKALRRSKGNIALITSMEFFRDVIEPNPAANPGIYRRVLVVVKETRKTAMMCLPDHPGTKGKKWILPDWLHLSWRPDRLAVWAAVLVMLLFVGGVDGDASPDDHCGEPVQLNVNVSAEKARVVETLAGDFESATRDEHGCRTATVQVTVARSAGAVIAAVGRGWSGKDDLPEVGPEPHVLLPDSSVEYEAAVQAMEIPGRSDVTLDNRGSIASSPLVLARPLPEGAEPDGAARPDSWAEVLETARRDPPGARTYRPSPVTSGSGLVATAALYSAVLGPALDGGAFDDPGALHDIELAVAAGDESGTLLCSLWQRPGLDDAVLVSEKAAADYNEGSLPGEGCEPPDGARLDLTYPSDGTPYLDHPFVTVRWHDRPANPARERVVREFHEFLTGPHGQDELRRARFRDKNGDTEPFAGAPDTLPPRQEIGPVDVPALLDAFHNARKPARVALLVDVSRAMAEPFPDAGGTRLRTASDAVDRTLRSVGERDQVGLWEFAAGLDGDVDHRVLVPLGRDAVQATRDSLGRLSTSSRQSRLYGTLRAAVAGLRESADASEETSDAVVVVADGTRGEPEYTSLVDFLGTGRPVPVFLIAFGTQVCETVWWREITQVTGGACHEVVDLAGIDGALDSVAAVLWGGGR